MTVKFKSQIKESFAMQLMTQFYLLDTFAWMNFSFIEIGSECFGLLTNICCCLLSNLQKLQLKIQEKKKKF